MSFLFQGITAALEGGGEVLILTNCEITQTLGQYAALVLLHTVLPL